MDMNKENKEATASGESSPTVIVTYKGGTYDISDFAKKHPGGKKILFENNGNDIEKLMAANEHSEHAYQLLQKYKID